jgi:hypothetical protein
MPDRLPRLLDADEFEAALSACLAAAALDRDPGRVRRDAAAATVLYHSHARAGFASDNCLASRTWTLFKHMSRERDSCGQLRRTWRPCPEDLAINTDYIVELDTCLIWYPFRTPATPRR